MGDQTVNPSGLAVWNGSGTKGAGVISESVGYAMILAALYGDRATFDRLSATVQAGIKAGDDARKKLVTEGNPVPGLGLFPWFWCNNTSNAKSCPSASSDPTEYSIAVDADNPTATPPLGLDSASDADINIALAYIYADMAVTVYGWKNPTSGTYQSMASDYIAAIREHDFSKKDTEDNNHVLADGYTQAQPEKEGGGFSKNNWHPDYSDIRAYQLFQAYEDKKTHEFWRKAIDITKSCWKAIFNFGPQGTDPRVENPNPPNGNIVPAKYYVKLSNPTYQNLKASEKYSQVTAIRGGVDSQFYTADSQRLPIRLLNYINAKKNGGDTDMSGIASANLTALGTSYTNTNCKALTDRLNIGSPYASINPVFIQNFNAAGLLAYASTIFYGGQCPTGMNGTNQPIKTDLAQKFGDGTCSTVNCPINNYLDDSDGFRALLSLWALTVSTRGDGMAQTPLQQHILSQ